MDNKTGSKLFLKPSSINSFNNKVEKNGSENNLFKLNNNPFLKCEDDKKEDEKASKSDEKDPMSNSQIDKRKTDDLFKPAKNNLSNLFTAQSDNSNSSNFIFGQNLRDRVFIDKTTPDESTTSKTVELSDSSLLFSSALSSKKNSTSKDTSSQDDSGCIKENTTQPIENNLSDVSKSEASNDNNSSMSLVEAARKYEEMKGAQKRKYEEVEVKTGEEDEKNILEMNCKLFTFDKNNWEERGRGMLRLNDSKNCSRVVFRASGSFRVLLNTKVWKDQMCEQPSSKSLRLTAFDTNGLLKIYLVMGKNEDIESLYHSLSTRIQNEKDKEPEGDNQQSDDVHNDKEISPEPAAKKINSNDE